MVRWAGRTLVVFIQSFFLVFSIALTLLFFLYGFNHYYLLGAARRYKVPELQPESMDCKPRISIHVPVYNEKYVIHRLISACARMAESYGVDRVKIVIIDDSDDETVEVINQEVADYRARHIEIEVLRRADRLGYKAGALQVALNRTEEEFIAVFDADFTPPPDFLVRSVPFFIQNERLGIVQSRWTHINRNYNILTGAIAVGIDVHFMIEQAGRYAARCFQNFNGSGGILRTKALRQAGGWQADTLAEDLDASYRVQIQGYQILYLRDLYCPGEVPRLFPAKKQQGRGGLAVLNGEETTPILSKQDFGVKQRLAGVHSLDRLFSSPADVYPSCWRAGNLAEGGCFPHRPSSYQPEEQCTKQPDRHGSPSHRAS
jgi:cellulose synthase/poly-beta-1,6-N-acetylglucosamine synthase-like glycosyltransferase